MSKIALEGNASGTGTLTVQKLKAELDAAKERIAALEDGNVPT